MYQRINPLPVKTHNLLLDIDAYKASHFPMYPANMHTMVAYAEPRKAETAFVGFQPILQDFVDNRLDVDDVLEAEEFYGAAGLPFNKTGFMHIVDKWGGIPPLKILAVPEGKVVPKGVPAYTLWNQDPAVSWLTPFFENKMLRVWYPSGVANLSRELKDIIREAMLESCDTLDKLPFMLHDFGSRGASSRETAQIGGGAHLSYFLGSDTVAAAPYLKRYYDAEIDLKNMLSPLYSIAAMEHTTVTAWPRDQEILAYDNAIRVYAKPGALLAIVIDSTDALHTAEHKLGGDLRQLIIDSGATVVLRHDSGDPVVELPKLLSVLADKFGFDVNRKGYKVLRHVRALWGDGINKDTIQKIIAAVHALKFSLENLAFGMGGELLQNHMRDDKGWAQKGSKVYLDDGTNYGISKDPITDPGKKSKEGTPVAVLKEGVIQYADMQDAREYIYSREVFNAEAFLKGNDPLVGRITHKELRANTGSW